MFGKREQAGRSWDEAFSVEYPRFGAGQPVMIHTPFGELPTGARGTVLETRAHEGGPEIAKIEFDEATAAAMGRHWRFAFVPAEFLMPA